MIIIDKKITDLQETIDIICSGNFSKNDVLAFMIKLRQLQPLDSILNDLCDFFAHSERDRGESHKFVELFLQKFIDANENNSGVIIPRPLFNKNEVVKKIFIHLSKNKLIVNRLTFIKYSDRFFNLLLESLDNVEYFIKNPKVMRCCIKRHGAEAFFCFQLQNISQQAIVNRAGSGMTCVSIFYDGNKDYQPFEVVLG